MSIELRAMTIADYDAAMQLWRETPGVRLIEADNPAAVALFLDRNPAMSVVATHEGRLIGTILCGHDGRRGYLHHVAVAAGFRLQGIGRQMVEHCLSALRAVGITRCHISVMTNNAAGQRFWSEIGWEERTDIKIMSIDF